MLVKEEMGKAYWGFSPSFIQSSHKYVQGERRARRGEKQEEFMARVAEKE
jgi:hypothetical protein